MTDHEGMTAIPTDVLRAWVESRDQHGTVGLDEDNALHRAAVAALPPPRRPVTRETPNGKRIEHDEHGRRTFIGPGTRPREFWCETVPADANCTAELHYFADGWYEVDDEPGNADLHSTAGNSSSEPEACIASLPGTRVGERMTEHTPVGAEVDPPPNDHRIHRTIAEKIPGGVRLCGGGRAFYVQGWTVVALPEEDNHA